ncbi:MAG: 2-oxo acid dehydrogenase subunit E2 [bacterium]
MIQHILMPKLGLVMKKGRIIKWYKQVGDFVNQGEPLFQISTEKVTIDVEAKASGYLRVIYAQPGSIVPVSGIVGLIGDKDEPLPDIKPPVYEIDKKGIESTPDEITKAEEPGTSPDIKTTVEIKATPAARRLAREKGIDLSMIKGSGPGGRITEADVNNFKPQDISGGYEKETSTSPMTVEPPSTPYARKLAEEHGLTIKQVAQSAGDKKIYAKDVINAYQSSTTFETGIKKEPVGSDEQSSLIPLTDLRSAVAERMSYSARTVAPVTLGMEVIADEIIKLKEALSLNYPSDRITINDILIKLVAMAIKKHPLLNASLEEHGIRIFNVVNIGIGVAIEGGLIVPAITNADQKSIVQISRESKDLIERARTGKLTLEEISRGTFTLTNLGAYGIDMFTPIINPPQSATLGIGRILKKPWVINDKVEIASTMVLSLTFDHRIIDGAPAANGLLTIKQFIENPYMILGV